MRQSWEWDRDGNKVELGMGRDGNEVEVEMMQKCEWGKDVNEVEMEMRKIWE